MWWLWWTVLVFLGLFLCAFLAIICKLRKNYQEPFSSAFAALSEVDDGVKVQEILHGTVFMPTSKQPKLGLVYLPGALVNAIAYAPLCREVAKQSGCAVVLLDMPMRIALFGISRVSKALLEVPQVKKWIIGGHSLGAAAAGKFIMKNCSRNAMHGNYEERLIGSEVLGLVLHAGYIGAGDAKNVTLSGREDLMALQVLAENDGIIRTENLSNAKDALPQKNTIVTVPGGNHAGFGHYGPQSFPRSDGIATTSLAEQQSQVAEITANWLRAVDQHAAPGHSLPMLLDGAPSSMGVLKPLLVK